MASVRGRPIRLARVYDEPTDDDGLRVLVDRLWPRGLRRGDPRVGRWCKEMAPSTELRRWYGHQSDRYTEFSRRYRAELREPSVAAELDQLRELAASGPVTLLTATKHIEDSQLAVLKKVLERR